MKNLIEVKGLTKKYGNVEALKGVNLELTSGKIVGLLGPNGSGKTTIIKILTGLLKQYEGEVLIDGNPISNLSKGLISYLPDQIYFEKWMKITDVVKYFSDMYGDFNQERFNILMEKFKIQDRTYIKKLSKGNQEKLQLALILSRDAKIYIFDEPIGGVDPVVREIILDTILNNHNKDALIILSTHQIYDVEELFDEVIFLKYGEVVLHKPTKEVVEEYNMNLNEAFKEVFRNAF
ncbi:putative ABC transporter-like, ATP-binding protein [Alteracholeplasma palmae J233]|uniref:Putative ABC transporter-like, ATP-binding protein n=1 Tax=Alteracholeplasma palmae (strain ATCC 49389 / J233) TaxID=1318466 RepID=U4KQP9_ALTPJ|nr:ABC transporter ATP-binding protein [Alteracholeplasma palmae]CCV64960.1 putative ABC transporter-like, ATP-binding protein [Alteracholeplasma palmae J233]